MCAFAFEYRAIYQHSSGFDDNILLSELTRVFDSREVKDWVAQISQSEVNGSTMTGASYYSAGDYTMPHTDKAGGGDDSKRRVAFILHLTREWNPVFGGDMVWMNPAYHIHPSFNSLTLFSVSDSSWHFVSPVAPITPDHIRRLAFGYPLFQANFKVHFIEISSYFNPLTAPLETYARTQRVVDLVEHRTSERH